MRKILIWDNFPLKNVGGASGYLYNIHEYLRVYPREEIVFLSDIRCEYQRNHKTTENIGCPTQIGFVDAVKSLLRKHLPLMLVKLYRKVRYSFAQPIFDAKYFHIDQFSVQNAILPIDVLNRFDYIHFHLLPQFTSFHSTYPEYKGKTILTSHCPCSWIDEMIENKHFCTKMFRNVGLWTESNAYKLTDYIMFPCKEAREPYEKNVQIKHVFKKNEKKFFYVTSSITDVKIDATKYKTLSSIGIPDDAFVICYFGRHVSVKGYDILKEIGIELLNSNSNLYFLCGGTGPIDPPKHSRWIELGFVDNANEWMSQCDLYILPNRDTYFDLILLEILRSSLPVIISETGGNKYFKGLPDEEIRAIDFFDIDKVSSVIPIVQKYINLKRTDTYAYKNIAELNRLLYLKYFTLDKYISNYLNEISNLK